MYTSDSFGSVWSPLGPIFCSLYALLKYTQEVGGRSVLETGIRPQIGVCDVGGDETTTILVAGGHHPL